MLKLYMHCGGHHVDREAAVTTPTPQRTRSWVPVRYRADGSGLDATAGCDRGWRVGPLSVWR